MERKGKAHFLVKVQWFTISYQKIHYDTVSLIFCQGGRDFTLDVCHKGVLQMG